MTALQAKSKQLGPLRDAGWNLTSVLRRQQGGRELCRVAITSADLADVASELWMEGCLRKGLPDARYDQMAVRLVPQLLGGVGPRCEGFVLEGTNPQGETIRREYTTALFHDAAALAAQEQVAAGALGAGDEYHYTITAQPASGEGGPAAGEPFSVTPNSPPLAYLKIRLGPLLARATTVGSLDERMYHVFYTQQALARAERFARLGVRSHPPVETGAVLVGPLCSCPETGELFAVVCDALEATDAQQTKFSLSYTGQTWARIQAVMKARQSAMPAQRLLGQCHGHNFIPGGGAPPCALCAKAKVCGRTSVFVSLDDRLWSRACFARQPWMLCHIFGLNARREEMNSLYGLRDNRLQERGFHLIPGFEPDEQA